MLGKRRQSGGVGHIKPHTQGTSNEISFSVLDAKRHAADAPTPAAWEISQKEVQERKRRRVRGRRLAIAGGTLALAAIAAVAVTLVVGQVHRQVDTVQLLRTQMEQIIAVSDDLEPYTEAVATAATTQLADMDQAAWERALEAAQPTADQARQQLAEAKSAIEQLQGRLQAADLEGSNQAIAAVNALQKQLDVGATLTAETQEALDRYAAAEQAMESLLSADSLARESASLMESFTMEGANQSIQRSNECIAELQNAAAQLRAAATDTQPLSAFLEYIDLRIQAQQRAIVSTQAYIDRDKDTLAQANDEYNALEARAAELIARQPSYPPELVAADAAAARASDAQLWQDESARAAAALSETRDYLG